MNAQVASARVAAIVHATEDTEKVILALNHLCSHEPLPSIEKKMVKGHFGNKITTVALSLRNRSAESFLRSMWGRLSAEDRETIVDDLNRRVDEEGKLYFRLDKQECFRGTLRVRDQDAIKVQVSFRGVSYPNQEVRGLLESIDLSLPTRSFDHSR